MSRPAIYIDTSIVIALLFKSKGHRRKIAVQLGNFPRNVYTGLVVRQEFKRRVLKEVIYILGLLKRFQSVSEAMTWINSNLSHSGHSRKKNICLEILTNYALPPRLNAATDAEAVERLTLSLETLLETGLNTFDEIVDHVIEQSQCAASRAIIEKISMRYQFPSDNCVDYPHCGIATYLSCSQSTQRLEQIGLEIRKNTSSTDELDRISTFINTIRSPGADVQSHAPCKKVGDCLIALESGSIPTFYTMNYKESMTLCRALGQDLIVRHANPEQADVIFSAGSATPWVWC